MKKKLISVIVAAYNVAPYLEKCVGSIQGQSYENIEIIIVDDGSTDESRDIVKRLSEKDARIKLVCKSNSGVADARNAGIKEAGGKYIVFVDGDDWVEPDYCGEMLRLAEKYGAGMVSCGIRAFGAGTGAISSDERENKSAAAERVFTGIEAIEVFRTAICAKLYEKQLFEKNPYPSGKCHEDEFVFHRLLYVCAHAAATTRQLYNRYIRQDSFTRSALNLRHLDIIDALKDRAEFFREKGLERLSVKTEKSLVGTIALLKTRLRDVRGTGKGVIKSRLDEEFKKAVACFKKNRDASIGQKTEVMLYEFFPRAAVVAAGIKRRLAAGKTVRPRFF